MQRSFRYLARPIRTRQTARRLARNQRRRSSIYRRPSRRDSGEPEPEASTSTDEASPNEAGVERPIVVPILYIPPSDAGTKIHWKWVLLSTVIMFCGLFVLSLITGALVIADTVSQDRDSNSAALVTGLTAFAFLLGGIMSGWKSPGHTIWEPAIAVVPSTIGFVLIFQGFFSLGQVLTMLGVGIVSAILGGFLASDTPTEPEAEPIPTPNGWTLIVAFATELTVSRIWFRDEAATRHYMADIDRSGFDGLFKEDDWSDFPRYETGPQRSHIQEALRDAHDAWVLGLPLSPVHSDYANLFAVQFMGAPRSKTPLQLAMPVVRGKRPRPHPSIPNEQVTDLRPTCSEPQSA